jgi:hypothetical protein
MFSPAMETYTGGGKARVFAVILALIVGAIIWFSYQESGGFGATSWAIALVSIGLVAWYFYWVSSIRVSLHAEGISYESCLGSKQMRWDEIEKFYYSATRQSVNFIPVGTYYSMKLVGKDGKKISFGDSISNPEQLGNRLIELTGKPLYDRLADLYNSGAELDFGPIKLQKESGFRLKSFFRWTTLPLNEVSNYGIESGQFHIFKTGQKYSSGFAISGVPNAFVLLALLDAIYQPGRQ